MNLVKFNVRNFRSVDDSDWITAQEVTALIGTNESGKTNLLIPLWKLNPAAAEGSIDLLSDAPRKLYNELRSGDQSEIFIRAEFELHEPLKARLAEISGASLDHLNTVRISRRFNGDYLVEFPDDHPRRIADKRELQALLSAAKTDLDRLTPLKSEETIKSNILRAIDDALECSSQSPEVDRPSLTSMQAKLQERPDSFPKMSTVAPRLAQLNEKLTEMIESISRLHAADQDGCVDLVLEALPKFVYYSNYGNLDSEIYLPHVLENLKRDRLGSRESAKARTLKVLFEFVRISPEEILELGHDFDDGTGREPSEEEVTAIARKKKERDILLQSASTELTRKFRDWWKQGEYRFRFQADGDHFRIWVSDDKRPEDIELEGRSTGLQWFLSFYLTFLVESRASHRGSILLLDEPGLSLHPLAQADLSAFFESLAAHNQLLYTTHSPFLVDPNHLDRVRAVYVKENGTTGISHDLRAGEKDPAQTKSIYPVHAALGLSVSDTLLAGSRSIIVEGQSDQLYLSAIKLLLIAAGHIRPEREVVFVPCGGVRGVRSTASILSGRSNELPPVLVDGDSSGRRLASDLKSSLYEACKERVISLEQFTKISSAEIEDLAPRAMLVQAVGRMIRSAEQDFEDVHQAELPIVPQIEKFAATAGVQLEKGWKVDLARVIKARMQKSDPKSIDPELTNSWVSMFQAFEATGPSQ